MKGAVVMAMVLGLVFSAPVRADDDVLGDSLDGGIGGIVIGGGARTADAQPIEPDCYEAEESYLRYVICDGVVVSISEIPRKTAPRWWR